MALRLQPLIGCFEGKCVRAQTYEALANSLVSIRACQSKLQLLNYYLFTMVTFYYFGCSSVGEMCFSKVSLKDFGRGQGTIRAEWDNPCALLACSMLTCGKTLSTTKCKTKLTTTLLVAV